MKALLIKERLNFDRSGEPLDKMNIGSPDKHIKELEYILSLMGVKYEKEPINEGFQWHIRWTDDKNDKTERYIYVKLISSKGWTFPGNIGELLKNPFRFINFLIDEIYGDIPSKISNLKEKILKLENAQKAKNILQKYNES